MIPSAIALIVVLLGGAAWLAWDQVRTLRWLPTQPQMLPEDRSYYRGQMVRRWIGAGLMVLLAGLLVGVFAFGVTDGLDELNRLGDEAKKEGTKLTEEQERFVSFSLSYFLAIVLVMFVWLTLAMVELMAIRRFGMRHRKRIRDDRRAMLMRQLPLLRKGREEE